MARKKRSRSKRSRPRRPEARLVQFEERRRIATRALRGNEVRIGRDPTCDLIVDYANVSRHHAVVRQLGDRSVVLDLGSTNGIRVNGAAIGGKPHLLAQGDVIELSEQVVLLYEEGPFASSVPWVVTAIAMLILLAASVGLYFSQRADPAETPARPASKAIQDGSATFGGPKRTVPGTHPGMPLSCVPQRSESKADSQVLPGRWYALARARSSGDSLRDEKAAARRG